MVRVLLSVRFVGLLGTIVVFTLVSVYADSEKRIARVLDGMYDDMLFDGAKGQLVFAEILADYYQDKGRSGESHGETDVHQLDPVLMSSGGCEGGGGGESGCSGDDGGGCGEESSGAIALHLQLVQKDSENGEEQVICWAGRPARPGWQRDPRLACVLPDDGVYAVRVFLCAPNEFTGAKCGKAKNYAPADGLNRYYLLNFKLLDSDAEGFMKLNHRFENQ